MDNVPEVVEEKEWTHFLSKTEEELLAECEKIIDSFRASGLEAGRALLAIRDERLYRQSHRTFEAYCRDRWDMGRDNADHLIGWAKVDASLPTTVGRPINERQARPLISLQPELQARVMTRVGEILQAREAGGFTKEARYGMTADLIRRVVEEITHPQKYAHYTKEDEESEKEIPEAEIVEKESRPGAAPEPKPLPVHLQAQAVEPEVVEGESEALLMLKKWWRKANARDRRKFLGIIENQAPAGYVIEHSFEQDPDFQKLMKQDRKNRRDAKTKLLRGSIEKDALIDAFLDNFDPTNSNPEDVWENDVPNDVGLDKIGDRDRFMERWESYYGMHPRRKS
jgi:hypothetical protein